MQRKSLSASLGSWCLQLVYKPGSSAGEGAPASPVALAPSGTDSTSETSSSTGLRQAALFLPAYMALTLSAAASCHALAHFINFDLWNAGLLSALLLASALSYGSCCGSGWVRGFCGVGRWVFVTGLIVVVVLGRSKWLAPTEESNAVMALLLGMMTILSVAMVGVKVNGRRLPLSAPLVPALALIGLLSLLSVDTVVQTCFMVFAGGTLYLLCYDRCFRLYAPEMASEVAWAARRSGNALTPPTHTPPTRRQRWRWLGLSLCVSGFWCALLLVSGTLFFGPLETVLPHISSLEVSRSRASLRESSPDFRGSNEFMELRGGEYPLSEREVMRVTLRQGESSGLWRGRTYERYERSRWEEDEDLHPSHSFSSRGERRGLRREIEFNSPIPTIPARLGTVNQIVETFEFLDGRPSELYSSGEPVWLRGRRFSAGSPDYDPTDGGNNSDPSAVRSLWEAYQETYQPPRWGYEVKSVAVKPKYEALLSLPGYTSPKNAISEEVTKNLQLPDDQTTRQFLKKIAHQIVASPIHPPTTPYARVLAVNQYLNSTCLYSLHTPSVPPTKDAVTFFLTSSHAGACDMFASSMALLLRSMDVPARVATGYLRSDEAAVSPSSSLAGPPTTWMVRERDAHAWVEYYVPELGWLSFDPTAGTRSLEEETSAITQILALPRLNWPSAVWILPGAGLLLLILGASWPVLESRFRPQPLLDEEKVLRQHIARTYLAAQRSLQRRVPAEPHLTPHEYEARVSVGRLPLSAKQEFAALTHLYIAARYGEAPDITAREVEGCLKRLRRAVKHK